MTDSNPETRSNHVVDFTALRGKLADYAMLYESQDLDQKRKAVWSALVAVTDFLKAQDFPPSTLLPIMHPAIALAERENNNLDPMFSQRARGGRPNATMAGHERTGALAAFANAWLDLHKDDDRPQRAKLSEAARKMRGGWFGDVTLANLKTAREIVSQEARDHPAVIVAGMFDQLFDEAIATCGTAGAFQTMVAFVNESSAGRTMGIWKTPPVSSAEEG